MMTVMWTYLCHILDPLSGEKLHQSMVSSATPSALLELKSLEVLHGHLLSAFQAGDDTRRSLSNPARMTG
jgi:hypothetical protein